MARPRVYVETTIVSYLSAYPSRNLIRAAHQQVTRDWWAARERFELFVSEVVLRESRAGDPTAAADRLRALDGLPLLAVTDNAAALASDLVRLGGLPAKAAADALHVAVAAVHGIDYLLTWNCTHIANVTMRPLIESICRGANFAPPLLCTPLEFDEE